MPLPPELRRRTTARLREVVASLRTAPRVDPEGQCKHLAGQLLDRLSLDSFVERYAALRRGLPPGLARTSQMNGLLQDVGRRARELLVDETDILDLSSRADEGATVTALACCQERPEVAPPQVPADAVRHARSPFEQWTAVLAVEALVQSEPSRAEPCVEALLEQLMNEQSLLNAPQDTTRRAIALPIVRSFARSAGFARMSSSTRCSGGFPHARVLARGRAGGWPSSVATRRASTQASARRWASVWQHIPGTSLLDTG